MPWIWMAAKTASAGSQDCKCKADDESSNDANMHSAKSLLMSTSDGSSTSLNMLQKEVVELEFESRNSRWPTLRANPANPRRTERQPGQC